MMRPFGFGSTPASSRGTLTHPPVDGALVPLDSRRKKDGKIRPRGTLGALILSRRLNRGFNWAPVGVGVLRMQGATTPLPEAGRRVTVHGQMHGRAGVLGVVQRG